MEREGEGGRKGERKAGREGMEGGREPPLYLTSSVRVRGRKY